MIRRRTTTRRPRRRMPLRRRGMAFRPRAMIRYNKTPSFVETYQVLAPALNTNTGGVLGTGLNLLPQFAQYQALYNQYRINWVQYTIIPQWTSFDPNDGGAGLGQISVPRIAYSIQDTGSEYLVPPASETDVLTDNGAKLKMLDKVVKIFHRPVASVGVSTQAGFNGRSQKMQWLDIQNGNVTHGYVNYWITGSAAVQLTFKIYAKVSFSLRDPK